VIAENTVAGRWLLSKMNAIGGRERIIHGDGGRILLSELLGYAT